MRTSRLKVTDDAVDRVWPLIRLLPVFVVKVDFEPVLRIVTFTIGVPDDGLDLGDECHLVIQRTPRSLNVSIQAMSAGSPTPA